MAYICKCDRCGKTSEKITSQAVPKEWRSLGIQTDQPYHGSLQHYQFCPHCVDKLNIKVSPSEETAADTLVGILESMVDDAIEDRS